MDDITIDQEGKLWVRCPTCGKSRKYADLPSARKAVKKKKRCHTCANRHKNLKEREHGFSVSELNAIATAARHRGWRFFLTTKDLEEVWERQGGKCALTGTPMTKTPRTWSIDRIDNSCGYWLDNIQLVLKRVNMMRGGLSIDDFVRTCEDIANNRKRDDQTISA